MLITNLTYTKNFLVTSSVNGYDYNFDFTYDGFPSIVTPFYSPGEKTKVGAIVLDSSLEKITNIVLFDGSQLLQIIGDKVIEPPIEWLYESEGVKLSPIASVNSLPKYLYNCLRFNALSMGMSPEEKQELYEVIPLVKYENFIIYPSAYLKLTYFDPNLITNVEDIPNNLIDVDEADLYKIITRANTAQSRVYEVSEIINLYRKIKLSIFN